MKLFIIFKLLCILSLSNTEYYDNTKMIKGPHGEVMSFFTPPEDQLHYFTKAAAIAYNITETKAIKLYRQGLLLFHDYDAEKKTANADLLGDCVLILIDQN